MSNSTGPRQHVSRSTTAPVSDALLFEARPEDASRTSGADHFGHCRSARRGAAAAAWTAVCLSWFCVVVLTFEEPRLARQFGEAYEEYRRSVPRWLPRRPHL